MGTLLHRLFSVRTLGLFDRLPATELSDYLSGLLIGAELVAAATPGMPITLLGGGELTSRYSEAATLLGIPWKRGPANSVISGQLQIARSAGLIAPE
jgi:2-dehydro-3-deoxygalactonokinase